MLPSEAVSRGEQGVHSLFGLFAPDLQGAGELGDSGSATPGPQEALGGFEVLAVIEAVALRGGLRFLPAYESEKLVAVAGGTTQADTFYRTELVYALRLAAGYLFEVRVV
jgi:hypothetical protein